jgi:hypothetical protein
MSKKNKVVSDLKKIIKIQEKIIKAKESEFQQVHKLFIHYLDKSTEGWSWYGKYYHAYNDLIKNLRLRGGKHE